MTPSRFFLSASLLLGGPTLADVAHAGPCSGGGTLTVAASADSLTLTPVAATTFNFGEHVILTAAASGFSIASYSWSIDAPTIKDYNEYLGTEDMPTPAAALPWTTTPLACRSHRGDGQLLLCTLRRAIRAQ